MEKRTPHYDLRAVQAEVAALGAAAFTVTATCGGAAMGLTLADMLAVVGGLSRRQFYKSMTTVADHRIWQDVYHAAFEIDGEVRVAYIKVTLRRGPSGVRAPVIQFKEK